MLSQMEMKLNQTFKNHVPSMVLSLNTRTSCDSPPPPALSPASCLSNDVGRNAEETSSPPIIYLESFSGQSEEKMIEKPPVLDSMASVLAPKSMPKSSLANTHSSTTDIKENNCMLTLDVSSYSSSSCSSSSSNASSLIANHKRENTNSLLTRKLLNPPVLTSLPDNLTANTDVPICDIKVDDDTDVNHIPTDSSEKIEAIKPEKKPVRKRPAPRAQNRKASQKKEKKEISKAYIGPPPMKVVKRKITETPFACICKNENNIKKLCDDDTVCGIDLVELALSNTAHIVNPGLLDPNVDESSCKYFKQSTEKRQITNDVMNEKNVSFLNSIYYKPKIKSSTKEMKSTSGDWLCVFCGQDNTFIELGPLYGPYSISHENYQDLMKICEVMGKHSPKKSESKSSIITSTMTRAAIAQGRPTVANHVQVKTPRKSKSTLKESPHTLMNRIGEACEVWCHQDCVLWAPGTFLRGDGNITGLYEALSMALKTECVGCQSVGAVIGCRQRGCEMNYHHHCALNADCLMECSRFTMYCPKHKANAAET